MTVSVHQAKTQLSKLIDLVQDGEEMVIVRHSRPVAPLAPAHSKGKPPLGAMRGELAWQEYWERSLTLDEGQADSWAAPFSRSESDMSRRCPASRSFTTIRLTAF